jgi:putative membrane protein insertion efficiency factor
MHSFLSAIRFTATLPIYAYKFCVSPFLPRACRYWPTCSSYAVEAITRHGVARGGLLTLRRLSRCHPWGEGGYDPVPPQPDSHRSR